MTIGKMTRVIALTVVVAITNSIALYIFFLPSPSSTPPSDPPHALNINMVNSTAVQTITTYSRPPALGPEYFLSCHGNQTVFVQLGDHPADTISILHTPLVLQYARDLHAYCDSNGNLIKGTNGQAIPFPSPTPPDPLL